MPTVTWMGLLTAAILMAAVGIMFYRYVVKGDVKTFESFRRWTVWTAAAAAVLVLLAAVPVKTLWPTLTELQDVTTAANAIGPLLLSVSVTLASIFYSAGEWYSTAQKFRQLGIKDARPNRQGRSWERAKFWAEVLEHTNERLVISGTTLGGWFATSWGETRKDLLAKLPAIRVQVLLANPSGSGFKCRADEPPEIAAIDKQDRARSRAKIVYDRIAEILEDAAFADYIKTERLSFYSYDNTPLSIVWADDDIFFTSYLPLKSDSASPEFTLSRRAMMGSAITEAVEALLLRSTRIESSEQARRLGQLCGND